MADPTDTYTQTRRSLHALAELVLAGPRFRQTGDLRLRVHPEGIGTWDAPFVLLAGGELVTPSSRIAVDGLTIADAAQRAGLEASPLDDVYSDGPQVPPTETVRLDPTSVNELETAFRLGEDALREFSPAAERTLWPEHFDVATTVDGVNYGVSPGDGYLARPYAYVGPHHPLTGDFWNAPSAPPAWSMTSRTPQGSRPSSAKVRSSWPDRGPEPLGVGRPEQSRTSAGSPDGCPAAAVGELVR